MFKSRQSDSEESGVYRTSPGCKPGLYTTQGAKGHYITQYLTNTTRRTYVYLENVLVLV